MTRPRYNVVRLDGLDLALDLVGDAYVALPVPEGGAWRGDAAAVAERLGAQPSDVDLDPLAGSLLERPARDLGRWDDDWSADTPTLSDWLTLVCALPSALADIHYRSPSQWLSGPQAVGEVDGALKAARRFRRMRLAVPGLGRCLPHALTLRAYLKRCGHPSTLVLGVRSNPFEAHCWLQAGDLILTDDLERLAGYTPIAAG